MEALTTLLASNVQNANVFRECGGARCAHNLVPYVDCRYQALGIVRELILSAGGDDDMATLLGVMHSAPPNALILKTHILKVSFPHLALFIFTSGLANVDRFSVFASLFTRVAQNQNGFPKSRGLRLRNVGLGVSGGSIGTAKTGKKRTV